MGKWRKIWIVLLLFGLFLGGCRAQGAGDGSRADAENKIEDSDASPVMQSEKMLSVKAVRSIHFEKAEEGYEAGALSYEIMDGKVYLFRVETPIPTMQGNAGQRLCLQIYDSGTQKVSKSVICPEISGHEEYGIRSVGLTPGQEISFQMMETKGEVVQYFLVKTDLQGNVLEVAESFSEESCPWNADRWSGLRTFHLTGGRTLVSRWDESAQEAVLTWFGGEDAGKVLGKQAGGNPSAICCDADGVLYCLAGDSLIRWDIEQNSREELFRLHESGIEISADSGLIQTQEELLLCRMNGEEALIYVLTDEEIVYDAQIRIACIQHPGGTDYIRKMAANFAHGTGSIPVTMEQEKEMYQEDYRNRIMAELAAGRGPEMLWLSAEDMILLAQKGLICDLTDLIPEEIRKEMIPAALEMGTVDGKLVGFTPQVEFRTMMASDRVWEKDGWTLDEFMELVEAGQDWEAPVSLLTRFYIDSYSLFHWVFLSDLADSPFLDLEQGAGRFDSGEFVRILELCKKYGALSDRGTMEPDECLGLLKEGNIAADMNYVYNFPDFSRIMERYGGTCHMVGHPGGAAGGGYLFPYSYGFLAVNAKAEHKEEIGKFIEYLLDFDYQYTVDGCSVRRDVIRESVVEKGWYGYAVRGSASTENMIVTELVVKPDGTTYLEEFLAFIESCRPKPFLPQAIRDILDEELPGCFEGGRSAEDTADVIQRRIQLYLDENR